MATALKERDVFVTWRRLRPAEAAVEVAARREVANAECDEADTLFHWCSSLCGGRIPACPDQWRCPVEAGGRA